MASLGFAEDKIGWIQGVSTFTWAISMPFAGRISDAFGRRLPSMFGLLLKGVGILTVLIAKSFYLDLAASSLIGLGVGLYYPIMPAISTDVVPSGVKGRALGLYRSIRDYGYFTGAIFLGLISGIGYDYAFILTIFLLGVGAVAIDLGIKETKPFWPAYDESLRHALKIEEIMEKYAQAVKYFVSGDLEEVKKLAVEIKKGEKEADEIKVNIDKILWLSVLRGEDKADFARLTEKIDRIAAYALGGSRRIMLVKPEEFTEEMKRIMVEFTQGIYEAVRSLTEAMKNMRHDLEGSIPMIEKVGEIESKLDNLHQAALLELEKCIGKIDILSLMNIRDFIEFSEYAADTAEDASDILRVMVFKHGAWIL